MTLLRSPIAVMRIAASGPIGWSISAVPRISLLVPPTKVPDHSGASVGAFDTWLIAPPVEPRPKTTAEGPLSTSMVSRLKLSRV